MTGVQVHTHELAPAGGITQDLAREAGGMAVANRPGVSLATMSDAEFEAGIEKLKTIQQRVHRLLKEVLIEKVHFGNPEDKSGRPVFTKPMLYQAGGEELRRLLRMQARILEAPDITIDGTFVSVIVSVGVFSNTGELLAQKLGNCNSLERRFERRDKKGWTYADPREVLHGCLTMATKRATSLATREAAGATGFFAAGDELEEALADDEDPMSQLADKDALAALGLKAKEIGIRTRPEMLNLIREAIGAARFDAADGFTRGDLALATALIEQRTRKAGAFTDHDEEEADG